MDINEKTYIQMMNEMEESKKWRKLIAWFIIGLLIGAILL